MLPIISGVRAVPKKKDSIIGSNHYKSGWNKRHSVEWLVIIIGDLIIIRFIPKNENILQIWNLAVFSKNFTKIKKKNFFKQSISSAKKSYHNSLQEHPDKPKFSTSKPGDFFGGK